MTCDEPSGPAIDAQRPNPVRLSQVPDQPTHVGDRKTMNRAYRAAAIATALVVTGCAGGLPRHPQTTSPPASPPAGQVDQDPYLRSLYADSRLDPIRDKVPLLLKP